METEIQELQASPRTHRNNAFGRDLEVINEKCQYTSLKDIISNSPTRSSILYEGNEFDSSNISIRNELVKRAASYYLQSAVFLPARNPNYFVVFWEKLKSKAASCPCWRVFAGNPIRACLWPIFQFLNHMVGSTRSLPCI
ncbi:hypothetical protein L6164_035521 [Bauhinia variegata]|uniref:Uncharacterized protein n=1 Tax=Bauhinia variegata TaxID=167791 RepID=A0ACB9KE79_BAUVA|nr:hypothetical protein L6164_035521 [Bauhinia variegata]